MLLFIGKLLLTALVLLVGYVTAVWVQAWWETKHAPREAMFECQKHGFFRKVHLIYFLDTPYCPVCFHESSRNAERIR